MSDRRHSTLEKVVKPRRARRIRCVRLNGKEDDAQYTGLFEAVDHDLDFLPEYRPAVISHLSRVIISLPETHVQASEEIRKDEVHFHPGETMMVVSIAGEGQGQKTILLHTDAGSRSFAERDKPPVNALGIKSCPSLGNELLGLGEDLFIFMNHPGGHGDEGLALEISREHFCRT